MEIWVNIYSNYYFFTKKGGHQCLEFMIPSRICAFNPVMLVFIE